jgi:hypothetical protein
VIKQIIFEGEAFTAINVASKAAGLSTCAVEASVLSPAA